MKILVDAYIKDQEGKGDVRKFYLDAHVECSPPEDDQFIVEVPGIGERMLIVNRRIFDYTRGEVVLCCAETEIYTPWRNR